MRAEPRPHVLVNMASSVDGKITSVRRESPSMTSPLDRLTMDLIRARADAIIIGANTLRVDNHPLHVRHPEARARRQELGKPPGLLNVLVSARLDVDLDAHFFTEPSATGRIVATVDDAPAEAVARVGERAEVWRVGRERVDIAELLTRLHARGVRTLLLEGGGELNWQFLAADAIDEIYLTVAPALLGGRDAPTLLEGPGLTMSTRRPLELIEARQEGHELYCHYRVSREGP